MPNNGVISESTTLLPAITKARTLYIHTGNIVNSSRIRKISSTLSAATELCECLTSAIETWKEDFTDENKLALQDATTVTCQNKKFLEPLAEEERDDYKITVKIFVDVKHKEAVHEAVRSVMSDLSVKSLETVIVSVAEGQHDLTDLTQLYSVLEEEVDAHRVYSLGISDLNKQELEQLYAAVRVKPIINQVNLSTCCVIPEDLSEFAKQHDVQLLTHNDPPVLLSEEDCNGVISSSLDTGAESWRPYWVARYSVLIKARGVIKTKGFIVAASRDL